MSSKSVSVCMHGVEISPSKDNVVAGGLQASVMTLTKTLASLGARITLVTTDRKFGETGTPFTDKYAPWMDVNLIRLRSKYGRWAFSAEYLARVIAESATEDSNKDFDLAHGHSGFLELSLVTSIISRLRQLPAVHTLYSPPDMAARLSTVYASLAGRLDAIIAVSENVRKSLVKLGISNDKIVVIPPPVDTLRFRRKCGGDKLRERLGIGDSFSVLFLGNLTRTKGIDTVLEAISGLRSRIPEIRLLTGIEVSHTGTRGRRAELEKRIRSLDLSKAIIDLGLIQGVERLIDAADVVVAPFRHTRGVADYPLVVLESMAMGKPVVTTRVGGIAEVVKDRFNGIMIAPDDSISLMHAIEELYQEPSLREELGSNASLLVESRFRPSLIADRVTDLYERITSE